MDFAAVKKGIDTVFQDTKNLHLENQKKSGICDRKDFGRVEASLYLQKLALVAA